MVLAFLDSAGIPLPAGVDALLIAIAVARPPLAWLAASLATAGSLAGFLVLYWLARKGGERFLDKHTASRRGQRLRAWFQRYGLAAVFVPALSPVPLPTKVFVLCAGALRVPAVHYAVVVLAARLLRYFGLAYLGVRLGQDSHQWIKANALWVTAAAVGLFLAAALLLRRFTGEKIASS
ncbi:MAG: YqaA family protein [Bryobacteraceae bacterium]